MVYVDQLKQHGGVGFFKNRKSCHMWADNLVELHTMAMWIGMRSEWFQNDPRLPHYDLVDTRRKKAVKLGAKEVTRLELIKAMRRNDAKG